MWADTYIRAGSRVYTCRLTPPYVWLTDAYMHIKKNRQLTPSAAKRPWCFQKRWWCFNKRLWCFLKTSKSFFKSPACFYVMAGGILPSLSRSFLFFRSSLHFSLNKRIINRLRMTGLSSSSFHPCLPSPFTICLQPLSVGRSFTNERRLKEWQQDIHSLAEPHQQGVLTNNERRKEGTKRSNPHKNWSSAKSG